MHRTGGLWRCCARLPSFPDQPKGFPASVWAHDATEVMLTRVSAAHTKPKAGCECSGVRGGSRWWWGARAPLRPHTPA